MKKTKEEIEKSKIEKKYKKLLDSDYCFGVCSDTKMKNHHVIFFDFDGDFHLYQIINALRVIQEKYDLSTIYILDSLNGYNAFCLSIFPLDVIYNILNDTRFICRDFVKLGYIKNSRYILRMDLDKKMKFKLSRYSRNHLLSYGHFLFFTEIMNYDLETRHTYNEDKTFQIVAYKSVKHGHTKLNGSME